MGSSTLKSLITIVVRLVRLAALKWLNFKVVNYNCNTTRKIGRFEMAQFETSSRARLSQ